jgi:hypothetical protein
MKNGLFADKQVQSATTKKRNNLVLGARNAACMLKNIKNWCLYQEGRRKWDWGTFLLTVSP